MITGKEALQIVDKYREQVQDQSRIESLDREFPSYAQLLGGAAVQLFRADLNKTGAFKWRGAIVGATTLANLGAQRLIVPSAGNHARGAVWAASELDIPVTAVVPTTAPAQKSEQLHELWPDGQLTVKIIGDSFDDSFTWATSQTNGHILHPFGEHVIPGQGTIVADILQLYPEVKQIILPIGGAGLAAAIVEELRVRGQTDIEVIAAEAEGSNSARKSIAAGRLQSADAPNRRYGGSAVGTIGQQAFEILIRSNNFQILPVPEYHVNELIQSYAYDRKYVDQKAWPNIEPTSLVAVAALRQLLQQNTESNRETVVIATGHNAPLPNMTLAA